LVLIIFIYLKSFCRYAVDRVNGNMEILPQTRLTAQIERIPPHDSFYASKQVNLHNNFFLNFFKCFFFLMRKGLQVTENWSWSGRSIWSPKQCDFKSCSINLWCTWNSSHWNQIWLQTSEGWLLCKSLPTSTSNRRGFCIFSSGKLDVCLSIQIRILVKNEVNCFWQNQAKLNPIQILQVWRNDVCQC